MATPTLNGQYTNTFGGTLNSTPNGTTGAGTTPAVASTGIPTGTGPSVQAWPTFGPTTPSFFNPSFFNPNYVNPNFYNPSFYNPSFFNTSSTPSFNASNPLAHSFFPTLGVNTTPWTGQGYYPGFTPGFTPAFNQNFVQGYTPTSSNTFGTPTFGQPAFNTWGNTFSPINGSWVNNPAFVQAWWNAHHNTLGTIAQTLPVNTGTFNPWTTASLFTNSWNAPGYVPTFGTFPQVWSSTGGFNPAFSTFPGASYGTPTFGAPTLGNTNGFYSPITTNYPYVNSWNTTPTFNNVWNNGLATSPTLPFGTSLPFSTPFNAWTNNSGAFNGLSNPFLAQNCGLTGLDCVCPPGSCYGVQNVNTWTNPYAVGTNPFFGGTFGTGTNVASNFFPSTWNLTPGFNTTLGQTWNPTWGLNPSFNSSFNPSFTAGLTGQVTPWFQNAWNSGTFNFFPSTFQQGYRTGVTTWQNTGSVFNPWSTPTNFVQGVTPGYVPVYGSTFGVVPGYVPTQNPSLLATIAGSTGQVPVTFPYANNPNNAFVANLIQNSIGLTHGVNGTTPTTQNVGPTLVGCCREAA